MYWYGQKYCISLYYGSCVLGCFLDASKAYDLVNHDILFHKLSVRGLPPAVIHFLSSWYCSQQLVCLYCMAVLDSTSGSLMEEGGNFSGLNYCPCDTSPYTLHIPSFVGKENFCESRIVYPGVRDFNYCSLLTDDILWDGKDVTQLAPAALSTILHTSLKYLEQPT